MKSDMMKLKGVFEECGIPFPIHTDEVLNGRRYARLEAEHIEDSIVNGSGCSSVTFSFTKKGKLKRVYIYGEI